MKAEIEQLHISLENKDYATHNFLQWYVSEQIEEEATARTILDKINKVERCNAPLFAPSQLRPR